MRACTLARAALRSPLLDPWVSPALLRWRARQLCSPCNGTGARATCLPATARGGDQWRMVRKQAWLCLGHGQRGPTLRRSLAVPHAPKHPQPAPLPCACVRSPRSLPCSSPSCVIQQSASTVDALPMGRSMDSRQACEGVPAWG